MCDMRCGYADGWNATHWVGLPTERHACRHFQTPAALPVEQAWQLLQEFSVKEARGLAQAFLDSKEKRRQLRDALLVSCGLRLPVPALASLAHRSGSTAAPPCRVPSCHSQCHALPQPRIGGSWFASCAGRMESRCD
jgi:hypothetical protein